MRILRESVHDQVNLFRELYQNELTEKPRRFEKVHTESRDKHDLGWLFVSNDCRIDKACRTYQTLFTLTENYTYYTPNTFYRNDSREESNLRWLNAVVLDVDTKNGQNNGMCLSDLLEQIREAGLPNPSLTVQTPSGGFHVYFLLDKPRRAYSNAITQYKKIQVAMCDAIGADRQAVGAGRFFRIPTSQNTIYRTDTRVSFDELNNWYWINHENESNQPRASLQSNQGLLSHSAVQKLLTGAEIGKRDNTAYTLALVFKAEGYDKEAAEGELQLWNTRLENPLPQKTISQKVQSAFKAGAPVAPTSEWIEYLSGESFSYRIWEAAKPREERKTSHYYEWANDVIDTLRSHPEKEISGSQREMAARWGMSLSTFQYVTKLLLELGKITMEVIGKGRGAKTFIRLVRDSKVELFRPASEQKINVPDSNTFILGEVVGGSRSSSGKRGSPR
ncbi:primase C-terminal domain-containing protein [Paenibacillus crassostreae]|uniref:Primase C-terminal 1 domain-containing protein n=1 Tax=Paenibacillus crassostreae TaxID=1763538 RepID=A0A167EK52_9BACL|nr:primase C-terminal domain-containing protein [Paenibacillus crassostreae]AOZ94940.1 hypothetical protein LPB68_22025 [Paenibacillus crassostreae]OAB75622.1 hypothetical protein PNBC_08315 [Paenibacillus crassostreae]